MWRGPTAVTSPASSPDPGHVRAEIRDRHGAERERREQLAGTDGPSARQQVDPVERLEERFGADADRNDGCTGDDGREPGGATEDRDRTR